MKLTARTVQSLKPTPGKRAEHFDHQVPGLALRVTPTGAKSWTVLYRHRGRLRRLTLGTLDVLGLAKARERARSALADARDGGDPAAEKQHAKKAETVSELVTNYLEKYAKRRKRSWKEDARILKAYVTPKWQHRAIADITRRDVRTLLDDLAERAPVMANRVLSCVRKMLNFAIDQELIEHNPAARIARPGAEQSRDRVLTDDEIRQVWREFDALELQMGAYFKLRLVTAQRGVEVRSMQWSGVDLEGGWWTIPASVAKNTMGHRVPLSPTALDILRSLPVGEGDAYVLAGARGHRQQSEAAATFTLANFRGHDLRRTAASLMAGGGVSRLVISRVLNHVEKGVTAVYDRHSYDAENRAALAWWDAKLAAIIENKPASVLAFTKGA